MAHEPKIRAWLLALALTWIAVPSPALEPGELLLASATAVDALLGTSVTDPATGSADISMTLDMFGGHPLDVRASYTVLPPGHARVAVSGSLGRFQMFVTPDSRAVEATDDKRFMVDTRQAGESWTLLEPQAATDGAVVGVARILLGQASVQTLEGNKPLEGTVVDVVELVPVAKDAPGNDWGRMLISIDQKSRLPLRIEQFDTDGRAVMACTIGLAANGRPESISVRGSADGQEARVSGRFSFDSQGRFEKTDAQIDVPGFGSAKAIVTFSPAEKVDPGLFDYTVVEGMRAATKEEMNALFMGRLVGIALMATTPGSP